MGTGITFLTSEFVCIVIISHIISPRKQVQLFKVLQHKVSCTSSWIGTWSVFGVRRGTAGGSVNARP